MVEEGEEDTMDREEGCRTALLRRVSTSEVQGVRPSENLVNFLDK